MPKRKRIIKTDTTPRTARETHGERRVIPFRLEQYHVMAWSEDDVPGRSPASQVHVFFDVEDLEGFRFALRFKTAEELDLFITTLQMYRLEVWGKRKNKE